MDNEHPWNDLSQEEVKEMVRVCRKWFAAQLDPEKIPFGVPYSIGEPPIIPWEWKMGDWFWFGKEFWIVIAVGSKDRIYARGSKGSESYANFLPSDGIIPIPLAYQWDQFAYQNDVQFINDENSSITYQREEGEPQFKSYSGDHSNPHFRRCIAYKKMGEIVEKQISHRM